MRLLLIDQYGELGGGQRCLIEAAQAFQARKWQVHAAVPAEGPLSAKLAPHCVSVHAFKCGPFRPTRKSVRDAARFAVQLPAQISTVRRIIRESLIDAIYVNGSQALPAASLARLGRPLLFHRHWAVTQPLAADLERHALKRSRAFVLATSKFVAQSLDVPPERLRLIYNGTGRREAMPARLREAGPIRHIATIGRIAPEKGQLEFVRAVAKLDGQCRFTIGGAPMFGDTKYDAQVRAEAAGLPIEFSGWTDDVPAWLAGVDLLVVPSGPTDNIPRVILEAFAAGVPVMAFPSGGIPELIENGVTGLLVEGAGLAQAMQAAIARPTGLHSIAVRAWKRWESQFTLERFQRELCSAVEEAVRLHHRMPPLSAGRNAFA